VVTDHFGNSQHVFHIPWTKSSLSGEDVYWAKQNNGADPLDAIENHFLINDTPQNTALFMYRLPNSKHCPLTWKAFTDRINKALKDIGLPSLQGHSIRIGATLEYLLWGLPFDALKIKGRWASDTFTVYLWAHAELMAPYMQDNDMLMQELHRHTMPPIRRVSNWLHEQDQDGAPWLHHGDKLRIMHRLAPILLEECCSSYPEGLILVASWSPYWGLAHFIFYIYVYIPCTSVVLQLLPQ